MSHLAALALAVFTGCTTSFGVVGGVLPDADRMATKILRPDVVGRSCAADVFGISTTDAEPALQAAMAQILALDPEGDVVTHAEISASAFVTGIYNRRCIRVRGDLARSVRVIALPAPPSHHGHH
jgi:hypothetical protein